jgi:hypothetical protein
VTLVPECCCLRHEFPQRRLQQPLHHLQANRTDARLVVFPGTAAGEGLREWVSVGCQGCVGVLWCE